MRCAVISTPVYLSTPNLPVESLNGGGKRDAGPTKNDRN